MTWNMKAVEAPASTIKTALSDIPQDVIDGVEEAFEYTSANPTERIVITFGVEDATRLKVKTPADARDVTRALVRSYCEARPKGRLTASIWALNADAESGERDKDGIPALSMTFKLWVKKEAAAQEAESEQPQS